MRWLLVPMGLVFVAGCDAEAPVDKTTFELREEVAIPDAAPATDISSPDVSLMRPRTPSVASAVASLRRCETFGLVKVDSSSRAYVPSAENPGTEDFVGTMVLQADRRASLTRLQLPAGSLDRPKAFNAGSSRDPYPAGTIAVACFKGDHLSQIYRVGEGEKLDRLNVTLVELEGAL